MRPRPDLRLDPYVNDIGRLGVALTNFAEILIPCLEAARARSVAEVGAYAGDLTGLLLDWAQQHDATVVAIDPKPQRELEELGERRPELELIRETSLEALGRIELPDAIVIDGDHNHHTVSEELRLIGERSADGALPLLFLHDVGWPHGRRDDYFDPELVPEEARQPIAPDGALYPDEPGIDPEGLPYRWPAAREGGPRNGVLTALEDFVAGRHDLRVAIIPAFFGLAIVWPRDAAWAEGVAAVVEHVDRNPLLARLELNRVRHLARDRHYADELKAEQLRAERKDELLKRLAGSRTFALAGLLSRMRGRGKPTLTDDELRDRLG